MFRIVKTFFYLCILAFLLPSPPPHSSGGEAHSEETVGARAQSLFSAGTQVVHDLFGLCAREPGVCVVAQQAFSGLEDKLKYTFLLVYEWAQAKPHGQEGAVQGSVTSFDRSSFSLSRRDALTSEDAKPQWHSPKVASTN